MSKIKTALENTFYVIANRIYISPKTQKDVVDAFHKLYYDSTRFNKGFEDTYWLGTKILKCPLDLWIYQELISRVKPDVIVETGTMYGGSALYMASLCEMLGKGKIVTVDIDNKPVRPKHKRITYIHGSSTDEKIVEQVKSHIGKNDTVLVILDSDHTRDHVFKEMQMYNSLVTKNSYMIVEDTNVNGHPVYPTFGPGPMEAVEEFMKSKNNFEVDKDCEKFYLTFNPHGYLKKVRND